MVDLKAHTAIITCVILLLGALFFILFGNSSMVITEISEQYQLHGTREYYLGSQTAAHSLHFSGQVNDNGEMTLSILFLRFGEKVEVTKISGNIIDFNWIFPGPEEYWLRISSIQTINISFTVQVSKSSYWGTVIGLFLSFLAIPFWFLDRGVTDIRKYVKKSLKINLGMIKKNKSYIIIPLLIFISAFLVRFLSGSIVMNDEFGFGRHWGYLEEIKFIADKMKQSPSIENFMINFTGHPYLFRYLMAFLTLLFPFLQDIVANLIVFSTLSSLTCMIIYYIGKDFYSIRVGMVAGFFLAFNPLFITYGKSSYPHEVLALFISLSILTLYRGISEKKSLYILFSSVSCGLALSSHEFSILLPVIIAAWILYLLLIELKTKRTFQVIPNLLFRNKHIVTAIIYLATALSIYIALFLWLWPDPINRVLNMFSSYIEFQKHSIYFLGKVWDNGPPIYTYGVYILGFTTPIELITFVFGIVYLTKQIVSRKTRKEDILLILWFGIIFSYFSLMPIKFIHFSVIFYPALAIICGVGSVKLAEIVKRLPSILITVKHVRIRVRRELFAKTVIITLIFIQILSSISAYPYYELYVSPLVGVNEGVPLFNIEAGGAPYKQAAEYLEQHCELNSTIVVGGAALIRYYLTDFNVKMIWDYDHLQQGIDSINFFRDHNVKYLVFMLDWALTNNKNVAYVTFRELEPCFVFKYNGVEWVWIYRVSLK